MTPPPLPTDEAAALAVLRELRLPAGEDTLDFDALLHWLAQQDAAPRRTLVRLVLAVQRLLNERHERLQQARERVSRATEAGHIGLWEWNLQTDQLDADERVHHLCGVAGDQALDSAQLWQEAVHADDRLALRRAIAAASHPGGTLDAEFRIVWPDGQVRWLRAAGSVRAAGCALHLMGALWDVTESHEWVQQMSQQNELLQVTLQAIGDGVITTGPEGAVAWMNPSAERLSGWDMFDASGRPLAEVLNLIDEDSRQPAPDPLQACLNPDRSVHTPRPLALVARDGQQRSIETSAAPMRSEHGASLGAVLVLRDVSEQRRLSGEMRWRASHDPLTGLLNRSEFEQLAQQQLERCRHDSSEHALLYIDLDQFKIVNDTCGHAVGDRLLQQVARLLADSVRSSDTVARLGGDEFGLLLHHCSAEQALRVARTICDRMEDFRFLHDGRRFRVGTSIGLVPLDARWDNLAAVLRAADSACYAAKDAGRNRVQLWHDSDGALRQRSGEMQWAARLEQALDDDRFVLHAQRIAPVAAASPTRCGLHAEVLLRLQGDDGRLVMPGAFLPAAERFHLASRIDRWVLRRSLGVLAELPTLHGLGCLSVNLSGQSIGDRSFHSWAIALLESAGPDVRSRLCLEITETSAVTRLDDAAAFIAQVRAIGVRVALDDFGAGASSFGYLKSLAVDVLKIDGQFIRNLLTDALDAAAVRCFVDVARVAGMQTVAEFVDNPQVLERLRDIGVDYAQGWLLHRPEPLEALLHEHRATASVRADGLLHALDSEKQYQLLS